MLWDNIFQTWRHGWQIAHALTKIRSNSWHFLHPRKQNGNFHKIRIKTTISLPSYKYFWAVDQCFFQGRNGKGSIYLFPAGNGKWRGDNCGADAYSNSLDVVTIASATRWGRVTHYSERCSAIFATTYSSGGPDGQGVVSSLSDRSTQDYSVCGR